MTTTTISPAEIAAKTLLAVKPRNKVTVRDMAMIWEDLGIKPTELIHYLQELVPEWQSQ